MLDTQELAKLHTNQRLLVMELQKRNVDVRILDLSLELLEANYKGHKEFLLDRDSSINPYPATVISGNKYLTKRFLQEANISVVKGEQFNGEHMNDALIYAQQLRFPLVVKPTFGSHGHGVNMDLANLIDVKDAIESIVTEIGSSRGILVEEQFEGKEYRVFVTKNGDYAVLHRDCAHVIGDGKHNLEELANIETDKRMNPRTDCLCPVQIDDVVRRYLELQGLELNYVPTVDEKVYLRHNSNVAVGATCEDYTDKVHPSLIEIGRRVLNVFHGLPYAGIDVLSKDITVEQTADMYRVLEVNSIPGIHMHMRPGTGQARNVAKYMAYIIFPETKK
ncbi:hypothetical protein HOK51_01150 [Candidatus Woesearchaeota archaeon]|jgi:cyanophycin synthetase|nr:hypothetical protein [Candidatus Woesearchaeota archaeon]MBT6518421.1 hypothetical protein [Candidatus Woesearchaeota archaeon]MBT7366571.1 hypothetical protein [Candidatus Woesearchaeota archaeon]